MSMYVVLCKTPADIPYPCRVLPTQESADSYVAAALSMAQFTADDFEIVEVPFGLAS